MRTNYSKRLTRQGLGGSPILIFSLTILFWTLFDATISYITPVIIKQNGFSTAMVGVIIGSSSVVGAIFDFLISKFLKRTDFRRIFLVMFSICFVYPLLLWQAKTLWFFIIVMGIWGIYFDLYGFGKFNFISRYIRREEHASAFGVAQVFRALGGSLAPLVAGIFVVSVVEWQMFDLAWIYLSIGFVFFIMMYFSIKKVSLPKNEDVELSQRKNLFFELHLWKRLISKLNSVLILTFYLFFIDAFFWTLAPLYAGSVNFKDFGGLLLAAYTLPQLITGWFIGGLTVKFGKKRTAYACLSIGSLILSLFFIVRDPILAILTVFVASIFISLALPTINSSYADYISDAPQVESEIEGLEDFFMNFGHIFGPLLAGILAEVFNIPIAFGIMGVIGFVIGVLLLIFGPRRIILRSRSTGV
ncbi:MFS transporter [Candidatus Saccharibacteria bacterium]|nr:MFS transporter [Candidatus Saccharibacteria bacterium]